MSARPLRILMMIHTRWSRSLGAPRVQLELGEELARLGCTIEKFSYEDAFPGAAAPAGRLGRLVGAALANRSFATRAARWVRARADDFDVIDANQTDLPLSKASLGFRGLLVARSVGLISAYEEFERRQAVPTPSLGEWSHRVLATPARHRRVRDAERSFRFADVVNVSNADDAAELARHPGLAGKVVHFPFGLSAARRRAFGQARDMGEARRVPPTVAFIGTWNARKGARDWPRIVAGVRVRVPDARFLFLGTSIPVADVESRFATADRGAVEIVPFFDGDELPHLLGRADVGAFPGYLEGFGFGVLEKLAAGLPTVTYDAPGARETMSVFGREWMVPAGDVEAFCARLADLLTLPPDRFRALAERARQAAAAFTWERVAADTLATYSERWTRLSPVRAK